jgi:hypothetical protein
MLLEQPLELFGDRVIAAATLDRGLRHAFAVYRW